VGPRWTLAVISSLLILLEFYALNTWSVSLGDQISWNLSAEQIEDRKTANTSVARSQREFSGAGVGVGCAKGQLLRKHRAD
jgi:hypothetical protein